MLRRKRKIGLSIILILILVVVAITISKNRQLVGLLALPSQAYKATEIPTDTTDLFEIDGYIKNDIVYIYVQGGPNWELFDRKLSPFTWIPQSGTYIKVFPYQSQIINPSILGALPTLTAEQAQQEVTTSAEMLYRTITYFKNKNKKVYVFCVSHGSQIGLELLSRYPNTFDGLALTMIRLDIEQNAIDLSENGKAPYFNENQEITVRDLLPSLMRFSRLENRLENMTMLMKVSRNRYTELLKDRNLQNVVYVYGKYDNKVGIPGHHEIEFLKNKDVPILKLECGHDDLGGNDYINQINQLLMD